MTTGNKKVSENEKKIRAMEAELNKNKPKMHELQKTLDEKVQPRTDGSERECNPQRRFVRSCVHFSFCVSFVR